MDCFSHCHGDQLPHKNQLEGGSVWAQFEAESISVGKCPVVGSRSQLWLQDHEAACSHMGGSANGARI